MGSTDSETKNFSPKDVTKRRIVKANAPKASDFVAIQNDKNRQEEANSSLKERHTPINFYDNPDIERENDQDLIEKSKEERRLAQEERHKAKRAEQLASRRSHEGPRGNDGKANPFSRFLSYFSVEPKFPAHKRSFEASDDEKNEYNEPEEKRLRPSISEDDPGKYPKNKSWDNFATAATVAAVAIATAVLIRALRK